MNEEILQCSSLYRKIITIMFSEMDTISIDDASCIISEDYGYFYDDVQIDSISVDEQTNHTGYNNHIVHLQEDSFTIQFIYIY